MRWPLIGRDKYVQSQHMEAKHAEARAIEDKHRADAKWVEVAEIVFKLDRHRVQNGFGRDLRSAMRRRGL